MRNKMVKNRMVVERERERGLIDSQLNSFLGQKISVLGKNFNQKSKNPFSNLAVILNLFQHLTGKRRFIKDLCLLTSFDVGQMLKRVQHDKSLMLGCVVLNDNDDKQLNKLINQELENNAKIKPSCRSYRYRRQERSSSRTRQVCSQLVFSASVKKLRACYFGICPIINISKGFNTFNINVYFYFVKYKILKKYMLLFSVLKFLNAQKFRLMPLRASQLKFFAPQTYVCPKFRFCFGDAKRNKVTKKEKRRLRSALTVNLCNISFKKETGYAFYGVRGLRPCLNLDVSFWACKLKANGVGAPPEPPSKATKSLRRRYAPQYHGKSLSRQVCRLCLYALQGLTPQGLAQC